MNGEAEMLVDEYSTLVAETRGTNDDPNDVNWDALEKSLCDCAEWNAKAAHELISLAQQYGGFMLRNAFALAVALEIEDGEQGF